MAKTIIGIEIGNYRIKMAACDDSGVKQMVTEELPENTVREGEIVSWEAMADFIQEVLKTRKVPGKEAAIVLPEQVVYSLKVTMPAMTIDQLKVNLPYEFHDYITTDKDQYFYDYAVENMNCDNEGNPKTMDLLAVAVKKSVVEQYRGMLKRAGLKLAIAAPEIVAYQNIIRRFEEVTKDDTETSPDYGILDIGHTAVKLHIYTKGHYEVTRSIEPGLEAMTNIIMEVKGVDKHIAEIYKKNNQDDIWENEDCIALYNRISVELMRVLNFYSFNNPDNSLENIYYCGGGSIITPLLDEITSTIDHKLLPLTDLYPDGHGEMADLLACPSAAGITLV